MVSGRAESARSSTHPFPSKWTIGVLAILGAALIAMPAVFALFSRAPKGEQMIESFRPFMTSKRLTGFKVDIALVNAAVSQSEHVVVPYLDRAADAGGSGVVSLDVRHSGFGQFAMQWGQIDAHMNSLLDTVTNNLGNYDAVAALPSFSLFPWFFVTPGAVLLLLLIAVGLSRRRWTFVRWVLVVLGLGLVLAPVVFQMFQRAPKGGHMMTAFKTIETTGNVQTIQGYFGTMAIGQGGIRLELVPALEASGLTKTEVESRFPAVASLDNRWVHILNDMTPMIGAMSDNVANYQAMAALPPFALFPYFFVLPGILIAVIAGIAKQRAPSATEPIDP